MSAACNRPGESGREEGTSAATSGTAVAKPLRVLPNVPEVSLACRPEVVDRLTKRLWPKRKARFATILHALRVFEPEAVPPSAGLPTLHEMRSVLFDYNVSREWYGGHVNLLKTRYGLKYAIDITWKDASQAHTDQSIALLAELGVSPDHRLQTPAGEARVSALLAESMANLLPSGELEWSAAALAAYLPPQRTWKNRFGQEFSFDQLARWLIAQPPEKASCGGTHALYSLVVLARIDAEVPIFSEGVRDLTGRFLGRMSAAAAAAQQGDGSVKEFWHVDVVAQPWYRELLEEAGPGGARSGSSDRFRAIEARWGDLLQGKQGDVHMTGHHLEWLLLLPPARQPPAQFFRRAGEFLIQKLERATDQDIHDHYCPYSHAARVVRLLAGFSRQGKGRAALGKPADASRSEH
jgi:hypothetical protein